MSSVAATSVGELVLELGLDPTTYNEGMENAHKDAIAIGQEIEANLRIALPTLTPKVNDSALTKLNQHFDLKESHAKRLNRFFSQNPLKVKVDFSQIDQLEKKLTRLDKRITTAKVRTQGDAIAERHPQGITSSSSGGKDSQLADQIGKAVARHTKSNLAGRVVGTIGKTAVGVAGGLASIPLKLAGGAIAGAAQGLAYGVTEKVSGNLGKGLSNALEKSIAGSLGSSELAGEKLGGFLAETLIQVFSEALNELPDIASQSVEKLADKLKIPPGMTKSLTREIKQGLKEDLASLKKLQDELRQGVTAVIGEQNIAEESLYQRGSRRQEQRRRTPVNQEQAAEDLREARRNMNRVENQAATLRAGAPDRLQKIQQEYRETKQRILKLEADIQKAQKRGASGGEMRMLTADYMESANQMQDLADERQVMALYHPKRLEKFQARRDRYEKELENLRGQEQEIRAKPGFDDTSDAGYKLIEPVVTRRNLLEDRLEQLDKALELVNRPIKNARTRLEKSFETFKALSPKQQPKAYETLLRQAAGGQIAEDQKPILSVAPKSLAKAGAIAQYDAATNSIEISRAIYQAIQKGQTGQSLSSLGIVKEDNPLASRTLAETLLEEINHAIDAGFGSFEGLNAFKQGQIVTKPVQYTPEEFAEFAPELGAYAPEKRALELNAKVKARRGLTAAQQQQQQEYGLEFKPEAFKSYTGLNEEISKGVEKVKQLNAVIRENSDFIDVEAIEKAKTQIVKFLLQTRDSIRQMRTNAMAIEIPDAQTFEQEMEALKSNYKLFFTQIEKKNSLLDKYIESVSGKIEDARSVGEDSGGVANNLGTPISLSNSGFQPDALDVKAVEMPELEPITVDVEAELQAMRQQMAQEANEALSDAIPIDIKMPELEPITVDVEAELQAMRQQMAREAGETVIPPKPTQPDLTQVSQETEKQQKKLTKASQQQVKSQKAQNKATQQAAEATEETAQFVVKNLAQLEPDAIAQADKLDQKFAAAYQSFKQAIDEGNENAIKALSESILRMAEEGKASLDGFKDLLKGQGAAMGFGSALSSKLGQVKGRLTSKSKLVKSALAKYEREREVKGDDLSAQQLNFGAISDQAKQTAANFSSSVGELLQSLNELAAQLQESAAQAVEGNQVLDGVAGAIAPGMDASSMVRYAPHAASQGVQGMVSQHFDIDQQDSLVKTLWAAITSEKGGALTKDLAVNTAGALASGVGNHYGLAAGLAGDLTGALLMRQLANTGISGLQAATQLRDDPTFKAATALEKAAMLLQKTVEVFRSDSMGDLQGDELFGDLTGFGIGNLVASLPGMMSDTAVGSLAGIPMKGAAAAMISVPQLAKIRQQIQAQLAADNEAEIRGEDLSAQQLNFEGLPGRRGRLGEEQRKALKELDQLLQKVLAHADQFDNAFGRVDKKSAKEFQAIAQEVEQTSEKLAAGEEIATVAGEAMGGLGSMASVAVKGLAAFATVSFIGPMLLGIASAALDVATEMEGVERRFKFAYGSMAEGRAVIAEVRADANALGADLRQALEGRSQLAIAAKGTAAQGEVADQTSEAITQAGAVYGLNPERQQNANLAVAQMFQKSIISAEELRGQLSETGLGNPIQTMADAVGVDVAELNKMMERRELVIEEVFPKFSAQLNAETSVAIPDLATSSQASINRFNNSMLTVQESIGKPLLPARNMGLEVAAKGMNLAAESAGTLVKMLGAIALTPVAKILFDVAKSAIASMEGMTLAGVGAKTLNFSMKSLTSTAKFLKGALGAIALPLAIFTAIEVIGSFGKAFKDAGGEVREFADQGVKSLAEYDKALADLQNRSGRGVTPPEPPQLTGAQTEFGDTGGSLMDGPLGAYERWFQDQLSQGGVFSPLLRKAGIDQMPVRTYGQVEAEQRAIANEDFLYNTGETRERLLGEIQRYELNPNGEGLIAQVRGIDQQLEEAQGQRRALLPGDTEGRRALDKQIDELLQQREKPGQVLAQLRQLNLSKIEQLQQQIQAASAAGDTESLSRLQSELDATTNAVDKLNGLIGKTPDVLGRLARGFAEIQAELEKVNMELDRSAASNRKAIASAQISGATPGELEFARSLADQTNMRGRMNANESAIGQARNTLESSQETMDALKSVGINSVDEINPAALTGRIQNMEDSTQKSLIEQAIAQKQQIDSLTTQNFDLDAQIQESQAAAVEKLRSLANQVYDFFRGIEQSAKEVQINAQQTAQQIKTETAQSRLKGALMGFQDSFLNDFVNSLIAMVDALNKPLNDAIAAQQQILSAQNQYFQQIQQSFQLGQQLPSNQQVAAMAGEQATPSEPFSPLPAGLPVAAGATGRPGSQAAIAPASRQSTAPLPAIPVGSTQMTAPEIQGNLGALAQLDPVSAQSFSQQGLAAAQAQAAQNYQAQVDAINQQLAASQQFAQLEATMQADAANRSLWEATRRIDDTSRGYQRSLEDLFAQGEVETPLTQIQGTFRGMAREFEDSMRGMEDFRRGLQQTVDQAEMLQQVIRDGVAQGIMPREMLQMLPQLQQMSDAARDDLNELAGTMTDYEQAYEQAVRRQQDEFKRQEGERRFQARQRLSGYDVQMYGAQAQQARLGGNEGIARSLEYRARYLEQQNQYEGQFRELQELKRTGQITANEFERMADSLRGLNQISLRNLRTEVEKTNNEIAASALFGGSGQDMSRRDRRRVLREAEDSFRLAASAGELNESQQRGFREAFNAVRSNQGASDQQLVNLANRFQGNEFFNQLMQMTGNGNITAIAGISEQTASTQMTETADQGSSMVQAFREANGGVEQRLDVINSNLVRALAGPRQLNVTTPDPVADTGRILNDLSNQQMKTAGI